MALFLVAMEIKHLHAGFNTKKKKMALALKRFEFFIAACYCSLVESQVTFE